MSTDHDSGEGSMAGQGAVGDAMSGDTGAGDLGAADESCVEVVHRLYHFLDGELTDERRQQIRRHLDDCGSCLEAFDFEAELRQVVASRCRDRVPEYLRDRVAAAIRHESGQRNPEIVASE